MSLEAFKSIKSQRATLEAIDRVNAILAEYQTLGFVLTLRQLFYQCVSRTAIANTFDEYRKLGRTVGDGRRAGLIDWDAIEDRTRNVRSLPTWGDPSEIVASCVRLYCADIWAGQPRRPEVWIEKDALVGVIEDVCEEFRVPYFSCRGNVSESEMYAAGKRFAATIDHGQTPLVLHLGDHDPNGLDMTSDIRERLEMFARQPVEVRRLALNIGQTAGLPHNFAKEKDQRYAAYVRQFGTDCWELDALRPDAVVALIREAVESLIDAREWASARGAEEASRAVLTKAAGNWRKHARGHAVNALKVAAIGAEVAVISTLAVSSYNVAFADHGGDWLAAAPLMTVIALESTRLPLAFTLTRLKPIGMVLAAAMLAGLSVITGEAASLAFENLIFQRSRPVVLAEAALAKTEFDRDALQSSVNRRAADIEAARKHREDLDKPPELQAVPAGRTCANRKGSSWNCGAGVQAQAVASNAAAMKAHADELRAASEAVRAAEARPAPDIRAAEAAVADAKRRVADARSMNPMFRIAAAWHRVSVEDLTSEQFAVVKRWAVIGLSVATALTTATAAVIASLPERGQAQPSKLARAIRAMVAARRKTLRRIRETVRTEYRDRTVYLHVPTDPATGRVLDPDVPHMDEFHDTSRVDAYMAARRRATLLHAAWKPMLAGAVASLAASAAVFAVLPRFTVREVAVDRVVQRDVSVDHVIPHDVPIDIPIPRVAAAPSRSKEAFVASPEYRAAELSGRIAGSDGANGFVFEDGRRFTPARLGPDGKIETTDKVFDDVSGLIGAPAYCAPQSNGLFVCRAWREGFGVVDIPVRPVVRPQKGGKPTRAPSTVVTRPAIEARR
jgi:hypothetical protein